MTVITIRPCNATHRRLQDLARRRDVHPGELLEEFVVHALTEYDLGVQSRHLVGGIEAEALGL